MLIPCVFLGPRKRGCNKRGCKCKHTRFFFRSLQIRPNLAKIGRICKSISHKFDQIWRISLCVIKRVSQQKPANLLQICRLFTAPLLRPPLFRFDLRGSARLAQNIALLHGVLCSSFFPPNITHNSSEPSSKSI